MVEISKANGTVELVFLALLLGGRVIYIQRIMVNALDVALLYVRADANLVAFLHLLLVLLPNLRENPLLLLHVSFIRILQNIESISLSLLTTSLVFVRYLLVDLRQLFLH